MAVIDDFATEYAERLTEILTDQSVAPLKRIRNYFNEAFQTMLDDQCAKGCLMGNLGQELVGHSEIIRQRVDDVFQQWERLFEKCLKEARQAGEIPESEKPKQLAQFLLSGWEGAIMRAKVTRSVLPMKLFVDGMFKKVLNTG